MQRGDRESWSTSVGVSQMMHVALYVRDAFHLEVPEHPIVPPPLDGDVVDRSAAMDPEHRHRAGSQWLSWWKEILTLEGATSLRTLRILGLPGGVDAHKATSAVHDRLFDWPALDALASWPDLRDAVAQCPDAVRWAADLKRYLVEHGPLTRGWGDVPVREIAERVVEQAKVPARLVRAAVYVLGVRGDWSVSALPGLLLCSSSVVRDDERMAVLLEDALVSGVGAREVPVGYEPKQRVLPPSVLPEPLGLWRTEHASLSCERVIPYADGFEVELRLRGLDPPPTPEGRGSRGRRPSPFAGLQVRVLYPDGREELLDDVERDDREGPVTITTFERDRLGSDTLWLWVMPLPPPGSVRLSVEWPAHGIGPVSVSFDVAARPA